MLIPLAKIRIWCLLCIHPFLLFLSAKLRDKVIESATKCLGISSEHSCKPTGAGIEESVLRDGGYLPALQLILVPLCLSINKGTSELLIGLSISSLKGTGTT